MKVNLGRCLYLALSAVGAIIAFSWGGPFIHANPQASVVIVTVFSVLAGFLVGIMGLVGDPTLVFKHGNWRFTELHRELVRKRLVRHRLLFSLYLMTLALIFASTLLQTMDEYKNILFWFERAWLALAVFAFLISFTLPGTILRLQMERYDQVIEDQRRAIGIRPVAASVQIEN